MTDIAFVSDAVNHKLYDTYIKERVNIVLYNIED